MNPIKSWNRLFFAPISARPLGAFRIVYGVLMLMYLGLDDGRIRPLLHRSGHAPGHGCARRPVRFGSLRSNSPTIRRCPCRLGFTAAAAWASRSAGEPG